MKRYMVFNFDKHYPNGGMNDFRFSFDDIEGFKDNFVSNYNYYQIFDTVEKTLVGGAYMSEEEVEEWISENIG